MHASYRVTRMLRRRRFMCAALVGFVASVGAAFAQNPLAEGDLSPIAVTCPSENSGVLEIAFHRGKSNASARARLRVSYQQKIATTILLESSETGTEYQIMKHVDLRTETDPMQREYGKLVAKNSDALRRLACSGSAESRRRFSAYLEANRAKLGLH
jgi:hypothetical protein